MTIFGTAQWVGMNTYERGRFSPLFRREFFLGQEVKSADLFICGLGYYEAWINGQRVGDHLLDPAQTDYDIRCFYVHYDVKELLSAENNAIGVILGDGWFHQDRVWHSSMVYGDPRLIARLKIVLANDNIVTVETDENWHCSPSPIVSGNIYAGEVYDARLEQPGWHCPEFEEEGLPQRMKWRPSEIFPAPSGRLEEQLIQPIKAVDEIQPLEIRDMGSYWVADMGCNFSGWIRIRVSAPAGTRINLRFSETVYPSGVIDTRSCGTIHTCVEQQDSYFCRGEGLEVWEPRFTYHGFRYVEITGWPGNIAPGDIIGIAVSTALQSVGHFSSSDERLNQLFQMAVLTHRNNIHGLPEDCPVRERCGWLGDAHIICNFSMYNYNGDLFWGKYLDDIETSRQSFDGLPSFIAPGRRNGGVATVDWMIAPIIITHDHYMHYGRKELVESHWNCMQTVMEHFHQFSTNWIVNNGLGDWFDPGKQAQPSYTSPETTSTLLFGQAASIMAYLASELGRKTDAERYQHWTEQIRTSFFRKFFQPESGSFGSQTANAMALELGFVPTNQKSVVAAALDYDIRENRQMHYFVGIMGMKYLFEALSHHGYGETALALMHQDTYPSFGDLIRRGATTLWEYWGEDEVDKAHGHRSLNHPMMGGYGDWFFRSLAGIKPDPEQPGFQAFFLEPHPVPGLEKIECSYDSVHGTIVSNWTYCHGIFKWHIVVPPGTTARVQMPVSSECMKLVPGKYDYEQVLPI